MAFQIRIKSSLRFDLCYTRPIGPALITTLALPIIRLCAVSRLYPLRVDLMLRADGGLVPDVKAVEPVAKRQRGQKLAAAVVEPEVVVVPAPTFMTVLLFQTCGEVKVYCIPRRPQSLGRSLHTRGY